MWLKNNRDRFEWASGQAIGALSLREFERAAAWASIAGYCAWNSHAGLYVSSALEENLLDMGRTVVAVSTGRRRSPAADAGNRRRWLHVLTVALPVGGHTRFAERWIRNRASSGSERHSVLALQQGETHFPVWLRSAVEETGGSWSALPGEKSLVERARDLRSLAEDSADVVVLHTHPNDPIATIAFAAAGGPPVVLLNHADHLFWFGSAVADLVADIRPAGREVTLCRRKARRSEILPIPLCPKENPPDRLECRRRIGLPEDGVLLLSIGSAYKYRPYGSRDFPREMMEMVRRHPGVTLAVIGPAPDDAEWKTALRSAGGRIRLLGIVGDISDYYAAADLYLESFPVGSLTATLDAALYGKPVVRAPAPLLPVLHVDRYHGMEENAVGSEEYQGLLSRYISDPEYRRCAGSLQKRAVEEAHTGEGWNGFLERLDAAIPAVHDVGFDSIRPTTPDYGEYDGIWADLQAGHNGCSEDGLRVVKTALRDNYRYLTRRDVLSGMVEAVGEGEWDWVNAIMRDAKLHLRPGYIGAARTGSAFP